MNNVNKRSQIRNMTIDVRITKIRNI